MVELAATTGVGRITVSSNTLNLTPDQVGGYSASASPGPTGCVSTVGLSSQSQTCQYTKFPPGGETFSDTFASNVGSSFPSLPATYQITVRPGEFFQLLGPRGRTRPSPTGCSAATAALLGSGPVLRPIVAREHREIWRHPRLRTQVDPSDRSQSHQAPGLTAGVDRPEHVLEQGPNVLTKT